MLSVMGLYQWDESIFNVIDLPAGVDRDVLVAHILVECAELEILISDPEVLKESMKYWSTAQLPIWQKMYNTTQFDYNPIWNKDGTFKETETRDLKTTAGSTTTGKVSAFNSDTLREADQSVAAGNGTDTGTITRVRTEQGNIGITSTQELIEKERAVSQFNIYVYITQSFKSMYCLGVY